MHLLGRLFLHAGFLGVVAFIIVGITKSLLTGLICHIIFFVGITIYRITQSGSIKNWASEKISTQSPVHPVVSLIAGLLFATCGLCIAVWAVPAINQDAMDRNEIIYFGSIFVLLGLGLTLHSASERH